MKLKHSIYLLLVINSAICEREPLFPNLEAKKFFDKNVAKPNEDGLIFINKERIKPVETQETQEQAKEVNDAKDLSSPENIVKAFGDPADNVPIVAQESAPKPYKAMLAALSIGNKELAFEYAKQYVRYKKDVMSTVSEAVRAQGYAKYAEGELMEPEVLLKNDPDAEYLKFAEESLRKRKINSSTALTVEESADELLKSIDPKQIQDNKIQINEETERKLAKAALFSALTPIKSKNINIMFFFKPGEIASQSVAKALQNLNTKYSSKGLSIVGLTTEFTEKIYLADFKEINGIKFEVGNGLKLANDLKVTTTPTVLIMTDSNQTYMEQGQRSEFYLDEIVTHFVGGK